MDEDCPLPNVIRSWPLSAELEAEPEETPLQSQTRVDGKIILLSNIKVQSLPNYEQLL
jgi:hypothetical protein